MEKSSLFYVNKLSNIEIFNILVYNQSRIKGSGRKVVLHEITYK